MIGPIEVLINVTNSRNVNVSINLLYIEVLNI
jgi:hypothetical protein